MSETPSTNPVLRYDSTITLGNIVSASTGLIAIGVLWGVQTNMNSNFDKAIDRSIAVNKDQDAQIAAIKENASIQRENTSLIKQDLSFVKDVALDIRNSQKEAKRDLEK
jgi:hypothetical protein